MSVDLATLALKVEALEVDAASRKLDNLTAAGGRTEKAAGGMSTAFRALGAALAAVQLANMIKESALMAARYETMGAAMVTVGNNAGYTGSQMAEYEKRLRSTGIAMIESRETLTKMAASHIDLAKATDLARIAQDAAVVGNINSSEAFDRMINGIRSAEVEVLRGIGLNVNFEQSYAKLADQLGKNAKDLTETEKGQARVNSVLAAGTGIAGTYEAAMGTAGKMINSMQRYADDLKVSLGAAFGPAVTLLVDQMTGALKDANSEVRDGQSTIDAWGVKFRSAIISIEAELIRLSMLIDQVGGTMTAVLTGAGELIDVASNIKGAVSDMYSGVDSGWAESELTKLGKQWNKVYEDRYKAGGKALQDLADLESKLTNEVKGGTSAQEQARIAAGKNGRTLVQNEEARAAALKKAEEGAKKARSAAEASAKASAQEYQRILDSLEPVRVEQEEYNKALAVLNKLDPTHETERYKDALKSLNSSLSVNIQAERDRIGELEHLKQAQEDVATYTMTANERQIYDLEQINQQMLAQVEWLVQSKNITEEAGAAYREAFGEKLRSDIQAVTEDAGEMGKMFEDVAKSIQGAFSDMFMDMMNDTDNALDSIGDMFKKLIAEMATMAIASPIIIPITASIGSAMGLSDSSIAKTLGVDTTQISGASGLGGIGGLFSSGSTIAGGAASLLSEMAGFSSTFSGSAFSGLSSTLFDVSDLLNQNLTLGSGILAGVGSLAMSLFSGDGITAQSASQAGGAAIGTVLAAGNPLGGVLGGIVGNLIGGMFGTGVDTFGPQYMANDVGVNYNATTGMTPTTKQYTGGDTDSQIAKVYAEQMRSIQAAFDDQVTALAEALPDEISSAMLGSLAATDLKQILNNVSGQEINVADAASWMEGVAAAYSEGLLAELGKAYGTALSSFISTNGAEGLVGDSAAWGMLTEAVKQNITDSFQSAAATIAGGDIDTGLSTINSVTSAIAAIESAMSPISEIIATNGLSDYELSLRSINQQFDAYSASLQAAGVDMAKYTDLETARGIKLAEVQKAEDARLAALAEEAAQAAAKIAAEAAQQAAALAEQRQSLEIQIMEATGDSAGALAANRAIELAAMDESLRPLQERIYALQDEEKATEEAAEAVRLINEQLERLASAKAPIEEIIATNGLSSYDLSLRSVNQKFEDYGQALVDAGVVLADYPQYYQAWAIELGKVVDPTLQAAADTTAKIASAIREGLQTALMEANSALQDAESSLRDAFGAEQDRLDNAHKSALDGMNDQLKSSRDHLSSMSSLSKSLGSSLSSMSLGTAAAAMVTRASAQSALSAALTAARNGNMSPAQSLDGSMSALVESDMGMFATAEDYQRDYYKTYNQISELSKIAGSETSKAEDTVSAIDRQITVENEWYEAETQILANQLNTILGINTAVLGMAEASKEYSEAQIEVTRATWELSEFDRKQQHQELVDEIKQLRADLKAQNDQIAINTKKTAEIMDKWDYDGMPLETVA